MKDWSWKFQVYTVVKPFILGFVPVLRLREGTNIKQITVCLWGQTVICFMFVSVQFGCATAQKQPNMRYGKIYFKKLVFLKWTFEFPPTVQWILVLFRYVVAYIILYSKSLCSAETVKILPKTSSQWISSCRLRRYPRTHVCEKPIFWIRGDTLIWKTDPVVYPNSRHLQNQFDIGLKKFSVRWRLVSSDSGKRFFLELFTKQGK
jgi:hypothetical protein